MVQIAAGIVEMSATLKIAAFNCNGVLNRITEIDRYVNDHNLDIMMLTETHLASGLHYYGKPKNYIFYRVDHPEDNARGGVGLLVKKSIQHFYDPRINVSTDAIQSVGIGIKTNLGEIYVASVYLTPNSKEFNFDSIINFFSSLPKRHILGCDFNCKSVSFGCRKTSTRGTILQRVLH